jgi:hypothetical protein
MHMERKISGLRLVSTALLGMLFLPLGSPVQAKDKSLLRLRAFAVNMQGGRAGTLDIVIERWSPPEEIANLKAILIEKGDDKLLSALQKIKPRCGYIRTSTSLGWDLYAAVERPLPDGGRKIVLVSNRPMSFWELRANSRSTDYQFTVAEIRLDKEGGLKGEGKLAEAVKVKYNEDTKTVELENYGIEPVRLTQVEVDQPKKKEGGQ